MMSALRVKQVFKCCSCSFKSFSKPSIKQHISLCHSSKVYRCPYCDYKNSSALYIKQHIRKKHKSKTAFNCKICNFSTFYPYRFEAHQDRHSKEDVLECELCQFKTLDQRMLKNHVHLKTLKADFYSCQKCSFCTLNSVEFDNHIANAHKEIVNTMLPSTSRSDDAPPNESKKTSRKTYSCPKCLYSTYNRHSCRMHTITAHKHKSSINLGDEKLRSSSRLSKSTNSEGNKKSTKKVSVPKENVINGPPLGCVNINTYHCGKCPYATSTFRLFQIHMETEHKVITNKTYQRKRVVNKEKLDKSMDINLCDLNGIIVKQEEDNDLNLSQLQSEIKEEVEQFDVTETSLLKTYYPELQLDVKRELEENVGELKCIYCDFVTNDAASLRLHWKQHPWKSHFECSFCSFRTSNKIVITKHANSMHKDKIHELEDSNQLFLMACDHCDFTTTSTHNLNNHKGTNDAKEVLQCDFCAFKSLHGTCLKHHVQSKHGVKLLNCSYCNYNTSSALSLREHIARNHEMQEKKIMHSMAKGLKRHLNKLRNGDTQPSYICQHCFFFTLGFNSMQNHLETDHSAVTNKRYHKIGIELNKIVFQCDYCSYTDLDKMDVENHIATCTESKK